MGYNLEDNGTCTKNTTTNTDKCMIDNGVCKHCGLFSYALNSTSCVNKSDILRINGNNLPIYCSVDQYISESVCSPCLSKSSNYCNVNHQYNCTNTSHYFDNNTS